MYIPTEACLTDADCCKKEYELLKNGTLEMCFNWAKIAPKENLRIKGVKPIRPAIRWNKLFTQYHVVNRSPEAENWLLILMF